MTFESGLIEGNDSYFVGAATQIGTFTWIGGTLANFTHFQDCPPIIQQGGTFHVGAIGAPGDVAMKVDYELRSGATLAIELAGALPWESDQFVLYGAGATLAGNLDLSVLHDYVPEYGLVHEVFQMGEFATEIEGIFAAVAGVQFSADRYLAVVYDEDSIDVIAALPGDANLDNTIDFADLLAVARIINREASRLGFKAISTAADRLTSMTFSWLLSIMEIP